MTAAQHAETSLKRTALAASHEALGARMVPFAGWLMPVQYPTGILAEHRQVREHAGLFDVSHMGQVRLSDRDGDADRLAAALERLVPGEVAALKPGRIRYSVLLNEQGGIVDDLMITRDPDHPEQLLLVINAGRIDVDLPYLREGLGETTALEYLTHRALLAVQGPQAAQALARLAPALATQPFMSMQRLTLAGFPVWISRSGYTGEDGFELSVANDQAAALMSLLLDQPEIEPIGLGARDSLRLEAGLSLYGHELDEAISPVEADLGFVIGKRRREQGGFRGAERILHELAEGPAKQRVGLRPEGRAPVRDGAEIRDVDSGAVIGVVTSGGFGPTLEAPVAMGYVPTSHAGTGTVVTLALRGRDIPATVTALPFVPARFYRG